jgi:hypothetical protein
VSSRLALSIGAVQSFAFGVPLVVLPGAVLALWGLDVQDQISAIARGAGAAVIGLGVIDWTLRDARGDTARALLRGNLAVHVLSFIVNGGESLAGHLPPQAASAAILHLALGVIFFAALRTVRQK